MIAAGLGLTGLFLLKLAPASLSDFGLTRQPNKRIVGILLASLFLLLVAGAPFWAPVIPVDVVFPWDRSSLPFILGSSLALAGLVSLLPGPRIQALLLAGLMMPPIAQPLHAASATLPCEVSAGSMDESFFRAPEPFEFAGEAWSAKELPDGRLLVAMDGNYTTGGPDPVMRRRMVRLNDDGTIDPAFSLQAD